MKELVSIIIVNWNGKKQLADCLSSLEKIDYPSMEIIVVDNGSTDGSKKEIQKSKSKYQNNNLKFKIILNKKNLGFAKANNQGFKKAKGEYVLILNNDTKVTPDFLTKLVQVIKSDEKIGVVQPKIIFSDSGRLQAGGAFLTKTGFLHHLGFGKNPNDVKYNQPLQIFSANGACMLVRRQVIEKVGLFDPDFFCYFEETDFCWRVWLSGYQIVYAPRSVIYHRGRQTAIKLSSSFIAYHSFKNRICSLIKNLGTPKLVKTLPLNLLFSQATTLAYLVGGELLSAFAIQKAILWNMLNLRKTLKKRKKIQVSLRKISDSSFIPALTKSPRLSYYHHLFRGTIKDYEE